MKDLETYDQFFSIDYKFEKTASKFLRKRNGWFIKGVSCKSRDGFFENFWEFNSQHERDCEYAKLMQEEKIPVDVRIIIRKPKRKLKM